MKINQTINNTMCLFYLSSGGRGSAQKIDREAMRGDDVVS